MSFNAGEMVGPYRIVEQLGQGGMATVYKAYHAALDRYVALKVLHPAFTEDTSFLARFQREARLVAKLDHPNIVPIFDYAEHEGRPYLVMKFIEGETLKARMGAGSLPPTETARVVDAVGAALAYAHQRGILHRDIKPSNVLLANDGGIYLADFGLARIAASGESTLSTDMVMGTPQYISPEQAMGKKDLDEGTDIYSFGVMLYELVVGKVPFSADTPFSIIHDHIYTPLPMPRAVNPLVSPEVERVLLKALAKERPDRYKDVHALVDAFQQAWQATGPTQQVAPASLGAETPTLASVPVPTVPTPPLPAVEAAATVLAAAMPAVATASAPGSEAKPKKKFPWMWLAAGVVLLLACLVTAGALWSVRRNRLLTPSAAVSTVPTAAPTIAPQPAGLVEASGPTPVPPGIGPALAQVTRQPDDPNAYVQLARAYYGSGQLDQAEQQVTMIEKLAPPEAFLWQASIELAGQGAWLPAARLRLDAAEMHLAGGPLTDRLRDLLSHSIYQAFAGADAPNFISFDRLGKVDDGLAQMAKARYTFYNQDKNAGQAILDSLIKTRPNLPEAQLLEAEFAAKLGKPDAARKALTDLNNNPRTSEWMRVVANSIKGAIH